jgi:translation initiation factor 2 beta subunit (eIF-2beta)/eIF-5
LERTSTKTQALQAIFEGESSLEQKIREAYKQDLFTQHYFKKLCERRKVKGTILKEGPLRWKQSQIYVPIGKLCMKIVQEEHNVPMARHHGEKTTRMVVGKRFYRPKIKQVVEHFVCTCVKCQSTKSIYKKKYGLYKPLLILSEPWESVSMDLMTPLTKWNGMDAIFVEVDRLSKLAKMASTKMIATTFDLAKLFFNVWVKHHGVPQFIVNDRDIKFTVGFWKHLF